MRRWALIAAGAALALAAAYVAGLYAAPVRVEERTRVEWRTVYQIVTQEKRVETQGPVRWRERRVEVPGPAGPTITVEREEERGPVTITHDLNVNASGSSEGTAEASHVETRGRPGWRFSVGGQWDPERLTSWRPETWTAGIERRLIGPLWLGVNANTRGDVGAQLGVEF